MLDKRVYFEIVEDDNTFYPLFGVFSEGNENFIEMVDSSRDGKGQTDFVKYQKVFFLK